MFELATWPNGPTQREPTSEVHARYDLTLGVHGRVALAAHRQTHHVVAVRDLIGAIGRDNRRGHGLWHPVDETAERERECSVGGGVLRSGFNVRRYATIDATSSSDMYLYWRIRHHREQRTAVVADALPDRAHQHVVAPGARARLDVWRQVRRREKRDAFIRETPSPAFRARPDGKSWRLPVHLRVAEQASTD